MCPQEIQKVSSGFLESAIIQVHGGAAWSGRTISTPKLQLVPMQGSDGGTFVYDSFIRVSPRKKRKKRGEGDATTPCDRLIRVREELEADGSWSQGCDEIFQEALDEVRIKPQKVLCLGLGSPSSSRDTCAQLALLGRLCASLDIDPVHVTVYDPVFTDADRQLFQTLGMRCLDPIQGAKHSLDCPTILYMPHCDLKLYETVIHANWTLEGLCNIVFLANCFRDYVDNNATRKLERESPCLTRLVPFVECRPLPKSDAFPSAFNNISVQYVSRIPLSLQGGAFWEIPSTWSASVTKDTKQGSISTSSDTDERKII